MSVKFIQASAKSFSIADAVEIILLTRDSNGAINDWLFFSWVDKAAVYSIEEISAPDILGRPNGLGIYRITGQLKLIQNKSIDIKKIIAHQGTLWEMHVLHKNNDVTNLPFYDALGKPQDYTKNGISSRYPLLANYQSEFGCRFYLTEGGGGANKSITLNINIVVGDIGLSSVKKQADFYSLFPIPSTGVGSPA